MVDTNSQEDLRPFLDKIMSFIGNLNDSQVLTCDEECKRKQLGERLETNLIRARAMNNDAPKILEEAENAMYRFNNGDERFNALMKQREEVKINKEISKFIRSYLKTQQQMKQIPRIDGKRVNQLNTHLREYVAEQEEQHEKDIVQANIANRLSEYRMNRIDTMKDINYWMFWIIMVLILVMLIYYVGVLKMHNYRNRLLLSLGVLVLIFIVQRYFASISFFLRRIV